MPIQDLALQLYSVRRETAADAEGTLRAIPSYGFNAVETAGDYGWSVEKWKDILNETGLKVVGAHLPIDKFSEENLAATMAFQKELGNTRLIVPWLDVEKNVAGWTAAAQRMNELARIVHAEGFTFYYHNHDFEILELADGAGKGGLEVMMDNTDPTLVSFEVDTYWVEKGGRDAADFIETYIERVGMIHAKELRRADGADVPAGQGNVDFKRIIPIAIERGLPVVVEFEGENAVPAVTEAATYLRSI